MDAMDLFGGALPVQPAPQPPKTKKRAATKKPAMPESTLTGVQLHHQRSPKSFQRLHTAASKRLAQKKKRQDNPAPSKQFGSVLECFGGVAEHDSRTNLQRYADYLTDYATNRGGKIRTALAHHFAEIVQLYLAYHRQAMVYNDDLITGLPYPLALAYFNAKCAPLEERMAAAIKSAISEINRIRNRIDPTDALLFEPVYLILRGNKKTFIELTRKGVYTLWSKEYPLFWRIIPGPGHWNEEEDDDEPLHLQVGRGRAYNPRPLWWEQLEPGDMSRTVRRLVPRTEEEQSKIFHSPGFYLYMRRLPKKQRLILMEDLGALFS